MAESPSLESQESIQFEKSNETTIITTPVIPPRRQFAFATVLLVGAYFTYVCNSLSAPFYPQVAAAKKRAKADTEVGVVVGSIQLSAVIGSILFGVYMTRIGVKFLLSAGLLLLGGSTLIFGFVGDIDQWDQFFYLSVAINFMMGFGQSAFNTTASTLLVSMFSSNIASMWAMVALANALGSITGSPLGGFLYDSEGFFFPFVIIGGVVLLFLPMVFGFQGLTHMLSRPTSSDTQVSIWSLLKMIPVLVACVSQFLSYAPTIAYQTSLPVYLYNTYGWNATHIGLVFFIFGGAYVLSAVAVGILVDVTKPRPIMILGLLVEGCAVLLIGPSFIFPFLSPRAWFIYLSMAVNGVGMAMVTIPAATDIINTAASRGYEKNMSLFAVVAGLLNAATYSSGVLCAPASGALTASFGFRKSTSFFAFAIFLHMIVTIVSSVAERILS